MLERIIQGSARNAFLTSLATLGLIGWGLYAVFNTPLDAIPDLSDVQVIVFTNYAGQAPQVVEDQVTYPLTTAMLAVPFANVVRGYSFFGLSFVYVIFEDGTDLYWARSRVLEYLNFVSDRLPAGVTPTLGPDAIGGGIERQGLLNVPGFEEAFDETLGHVPELQPPSSRLEEGLACFAHFREAAGSGLITVSRCDDELLLRGDELRRVDLHKGLAAANLLPLVLDVQLLDPPLDLGVDVLY